MIRDQIRVSSEIDAYCTKCRMVTNHRVVAMVGGVVKRVICLTCDGQHNFRPPPGQKKESSTKAKRIQKEKKRVRGESVNDKPAYQQWVEWKENLEDEPRPYNMSESYERDEPLMHPKFGLGFVIKVVGNQKIEIMFEKEIKTLAMNYKL